MFVVILQQILIFLITILVIIAPTLVMIYIADKKANVKKKILMRWIAGWTMLVVIISLIISKMIQGYL